MTHDEALEQFHLDMSHAICDGDRKFAVHMLADRIGDVARAISAAIRAALRAKTRAELLAIARELGVDTHPEFII